MTMPKFAVGVSPKFRRVTIPNNSLVDFDDLLYTAPNNQCCKEDPSNQRTDLHDEALLCITDLTDCCESPHAVRGDWYYPSGSRVLFDGNPLNLVFRRNRGPKEMIDGRQFYGSVRLFRRYGPKERGRFRCELPSAANASVNQTLYAYIGEIIIYLMCILQNMIRSTLL